jgi:hypothetical protein
MAIIVITLAKPDIVRFITGVISIKILFECECNGFFAVHISCKTILFGAQLLAEFFQKTNKKPL